MLNIPTENVKLTLEQLQQIDVVQKQLGNLESEIKNSQKILKGIKIETDRTVKEKLYQEELFSNLTEQIELLKSHKDDLLKEIDLGNRNLSDIYQKERDVNKFIEIKSKELSEREKCVLSQEDILKGKQEDFNIKANKLLEDELSIKTAKDAFSKALETVVW